LEPSTWDLSLLFFSQLSDPWILRPRISDTGSRKPSARQLAATRLRESNRGAAAVRPARANYYEVGLTKAILGKLRLDANVFRRDIRNYSDDDVLLDTRISRQRSLAPGFSAV
jgi:hypothetical protein